MNVKDSDHAFRIVRMLVSQADDPMAYWCNLCGDIVLGDDTTFCPDCWETLGEIPSWLKALSAWAKSILAYGQETTTMMPGPGENEVMAISNIWVINLVGEFAKAIIEPMHKAKMVVPE